MNESLGLLAGLEASVELLYVNGGVSPLIFTRPRCSAQPGIGVKVDGKVPRGAFCQRSIHSSEACAHGHFNRVSLILDVWVEPLEQSGQSVDLDIPIIRHDIC